MRRQLKRVILLVFLTCVLLLPIVSAETTIQGTVYDMFLNEIDKAVITITTEPIQTVVSTNGEYSLRVPQGTYTITAMYETPSEQYTVEEPLTITSDGVFTIDLILAPTLDDFDELTTESEEFMLEEPESSKTGLIATIIVLFLILLYLRMAKKHFVNNDDLKSEADELLEKVYRFIKEEGGRTTQKDIRKQFPSSEAKVSLMITELEEQGRVKKIKKGRGNIIIITGK